MSKSKVTSRRLGGAVRSGAALALAAALAAGCSTVGTSDAVVPADHDYRVRHPILVSEEPEVFTLPVGMNGPAVSRQIEERLGYYVDGYLADGTGALAIQVPAAAANEMAAAATGRALHYALVRAGVPHASIQVAPYHVGDHAKVAPVRLSYLKVKATTPTCGTWPETEHNNYRNAQFQNFGCATQQNLAAMVADPADLVYPRPMSPANGDRRAKAIKIYIDIGNTGWQPVPPNALIGGGVEEAAQ